MRYLLLLVTVLTLAAGCNKHDKPTPPKQTVTITSDTIIVGCIGGPQYSIECTLLGNGDNTRLWASSDAEWLTIKSCGVRSINFVVESNPEDTPREATITAHFGEGSDSITITQRPRADKEFVAYSIEGSEYYGKGEHGMYNYYVVLSSYGLANNGNMAEDSTYYLFDLYSTKNTYRDNNWRIPNGEYSFENGGIGSEYSYYCKTGVATTEDGSDVAVEEMTFTSASLTVTNGHIEARVTLESGEVVNVSYSGTLEVTEYFSTLEESYKFDTRDAQFVGERLGDLYNNGTYTTVLYIFDELNTEENSYTGDIFQFYLTHSEPDRPFEGYYSIGIGNYRCVAGDVERDGGKLTMTGSWYMTADMSSYAPLKSGNLQISKDDEEHYTISINFTDDRRHTIKGSYHATGEIVE